MNYMKHAYLFLKLLVILFVTFLRVVGYAQGYILPPSNTNTFYTSNGTITGPRTVTLQDQLSFDAPALFMGRFGRPYYSISGYGQKQFTIATGESASVLGTGDSLALFGNQIYLNSGSINQFNNQPILINSSRQLTAPNYSLPTTQPANGTYSLSFTNGIGTFAVASVPYNTLEIASGQNLAFAPTVSNYVCNTNAGNITFNNLGAPSSSNVSFIHKTSASNNITIDASTITYIYRGTTYSSGTFVLTERNTYIIVPIGSTFLIAD